MFRIAMVLAFSVSMSIAIMGCDGGAAGKGSSVGVKPGENVLPRIDPKKEKDLVSSDTDVAVTMTIRNMTKSTISLHWLDETTGDRFYYKDIKAGAEVVQETFQDHYWIILDKNAKPLGIYKAQDKDGVVVIH